MWAESLVRPEESGHHSPGFMVLSIVLAGVVLLGYGIVTFAVTVVHEGGHALVTTLVGGWVDRITMDRHGGGLTESYGLGRMGYALSLLSGYTAPTVAGLAGLALVLAGHPAAVLWMTAGLLLLFLIKARKPIAVLVALWMITMMIILVLYGSSWLQDLFATSWVWILLVAAILDAYTLKLVVSSGSHENDAGYLRTALWLPIRFWSWLFRVLTYAGLAVAIALVMN